MSSPAKGPRLYLRQGRLDRRTARVLPPRYFIRDGPLELSTRCGPHELAEAERALSAYLITKVGLPDDPAWAHDPTRVTVLDVLQFYERGRVPTLADQTSARGFIKHLRRWWGTKALTAVRRSECLNYVAHRSSEKNSRAKWKPNGISTATARRELETLSASIGFWDQEYQLSRRPKVTLPPRRESPRDALTRPEVAKLLKAARGYRLQPDGTWMYLGRRTADNRAYLRRAILMGVYTGSRPGVVCRVLWLPSAQAPFVDLESGVLYRRGREVAEKRRKRTPPVKLSPRLLAHLRRWRRLDLDRSALEIGEQESFSSAGVIHWKGRPVGELAGRGFEGCVRDAGLPTVITPHWLRHTTTTWLMEANVELWAAAGFLGMTQSTLERHYGHHRPDFQAQAIGGLSSAAGGRLVAKGT